MFGAWLLVGQGTNDSPWLSVPGAGCVPWLCHAHPEQKAQLPCTIWGHILHWEQLRAPQGCPWSIRAR